MVGMKKRFIGGLVLFLIILFILLLPFFISSHGGVSSPYSSKKVGLVSISGVILSPYPYIKEIRRFARRDDISAILIRVNSPGGAVAPSQEIYREIIKAKKKKLVVVSMGSVAASGAYYLSSAASYIFANPGTITGSIGVIMEYMNVGDLIKWMKIKPVVIKSGKFKDTGSPYRNLSPAEKQYLQGIIMDIYSQFLNDVYKARKKKGVKKSFLKKIADGRVFSGKEALKYHLVDKIGDFYDAVSYIQKKLGIKKEPKLIYYEKKKGFFERFFDSLTSIIGRGETNVSHFALVPTTGYNIFYLWR